MRKSSLILAAVMLLLTPFTASATDINNRNYSYDWSGFYLGGVAGFAGVDVDWKNPGTPEQKLDGAMVGGRLGYDHQLRGSRVVIGFAVEGLFGDLFDSKRDGNYIVETGRVENMYSILARLGYAAGSNGEALVYVTGGPSWARMTQTQSCPAPAAAPFGWCNTHGPYNLSTTDTLSGWTIGGGIETAIGDGSWTLGLEGRYFKFDSNNFILSPDATGKRLPDQITRTDGYFVGATLMKRFSF